MSSLKKPSPANASNLTLPAKGAKGRLMMTAATLAVGVVGYGRSAYAACTASPDSYNFSCEGVTTTEQSISSPYGNDISVTTTGDFAVDSPTNGISLTSTYYYDPGNVDGKYTGVGNITVNDGGDQNAITAVNDGIVASSDGGSVYMDLSGPIIAGGDGIKVTGTLSTVEITVTGDVTADGTGIRADSVVGGGGYGEGYYGGYEGYYYYYGSLDIDVGQSNDPSVVSGKTGIYAKTDGTDYSVNTSITVRENSVVTGTDGYGIDLVQINADRTWSNINMRKGSVVNGGIRLRADVGYHGIYISDGATVNGDVDSDVTLGAKYRPNGAAVRNFGMIDGDVRLGDLNNRFVTDSTASVTGDVDAGGESAPQVNDEMDYFGPNKYADRLEFRTDYGQFNNPVGGFTEGPTVNLSHVDFDGNEEAGERFINFESVSVSANYDSVANLTGTTDDSGVLLATYGGVNIAGSATNLELSTGNSFWRKGPSSGIVIGGTGTIGDIALTSRGVISPGTLTSGKYLGGNSVEMPPYDQYSTSPIGSRISQIGTLTVSGDINFDAPPIDILRIDAPLNDEMIQPVEITPADAVLDIQIAADGSYDKLIVGGSIDLSRFDLAVRSEDTGPDFAVYDELVIVEAGSVIGEFNSFTDNVVDLDIMQVTTATDVTLTWGLAENQSDKDAAPAGGFAAAAGHLSFTNALGGEFQSTLSGLGLGDMNSGLAVTSAHQSPLDPLVADSSNDTTQLVANSRLIGSAIGEQIEVSARDGNAGLDATVGGAFIGAETYIDVEGGRLAFGGAIGQTQSQSEVENGKADVTGQHIGIVGGYVTGDYVISGVLSFANLDMETFRELGAVDGQGETSGTSIAASFTVSRDMADRFDTSFSKIAPFVGLKTITTKFDGFAETGTTLVVDDSETTTHFLSVGAEFERDVMIGNASVGTSLTLGWEHAMGDLAVTSISNVGVGGDFITETAPIDANRALIGVGMSFGEGNLQGQVGFEGSFGSNSSDRAVRIGFTYTH